MVGDRKSKKEQARSKISFKQADFAGRWEL